MSRLELITVVLQWLSLVRYVNEGWRIEATFRLWVTCRNANIISVMLTNHDISTLPPKTAANFFSAEAEAAKPNISANAPKYGGAGV